MSTPKAPHHDDVSPEPSAAERPFYLRWADMECFVHRAQSVAKMLENYCHDKAEQPGSNQPLPFLNLLISDLGNIAEAIGSDLEKALTQLSELESELYQRE